MIEIVAKIAVNSRIKTSEPGKKYSRYETDCSPAPGKRNEGPKPAPNSSQKIKRLADRPHDAIALPDEAHPFARDERAHRQPGTRLERRGRDVDGRDRGVFQHS